MAVGVVQRFGLVEKAGLDRVRGGRVAERSELHAPALPDREDGGIADVVTADPVFFDLGDRDRRAGADAERDDGAVRFIERVQDSGPYRIAAAYAAKVCFHGTDDGLRRAFAARAPAQTVGDDQRSAARVDAEYGGGIFVCRLEP